LDERRRNVRGAFAATRAPPGRIVLVDDVYTTGATASEAARCLLRAGARRVDVVTFARTVRRG
jgi:predicted amidophosphoribosyltransferase